MNEKISHNAIVSDIDNFSHYLNIFKFAMLRQNNRPKTAALYEAICEVIPGGVNSPVRAFPGMSIPPLILGKAKGDMITDVDGNEYIDYCGSWGALIHGHAHPQIIEAATRRMSQGTSFGISTEIEEKLARKVCEFVPSCQKVRFVSSGTEATMSAVRLARGFTGRPLVVTFIGNYHGHNDSFLVQAGSGVTSLPNASSAGVPDELVQMMLSLPYNNIAAFDALLEKKEIREKIACVIVEPIAANMGVVPGTRDFLSHLRKRTEEIGALLVFDEVVSGFRVAKGGAQELYRLMPDISCFAKIVGGGFPAACFGGKREIMDFLAPLGPVYQAGTLSGNPVAMEAGLQALLLLEEPNFYENLEAKAEIITKPLTEMIEKEGIAAHVQRIGSLFTIFFTSHPVRNMQEAKGGDTTRFKQMFLHLFNHGVYAPPSQFEAWFVSAAHTRVHLEYARDLLIDFMKRMG
jgi:glutamate-1-semialdehyde 2,1-aminomutase